MLPSLIAFLESQLGRDNPLVAWLLWISSVVGESSMKAYSWILALFVWAAFTYVLISKRAAGGSSYSSQGKPLWPMAYLVDHFWKVSTEFVIGSVVVYTVFGTSFLFDAFGPLLGYFSDGETASAGLKFLFAYDTSGTGYLAYFTGAVILWCYCLVRSAYAGTMYYFVFKGEAVVGGNQTSFLSQFKAFSTVLVAITAICFSTLPEGVVNLALSPFGSSVREIVTGK